MPDPCKDKRKALQDANRKLTDTKKVYDRSLEKEDDSENQWIEDGVLTSALTVIAYIVASAATDGAAIPIIAAGTAGGGAGGVSGWFSDEDDVEESWDVSNNAEEDYLEADGSADIARQDLKHCEKDNADQDKDGIPAKDDPDDDMPLGDADLPDAMPLGDEDYKDIQSTKGDYYLAPPIDLEL